MVYRFSDWSLIYRRYHKTSLIIVLPINWTSSAAISMRPVPTSFGFSIIRNQLRYLIKRILDQRSWLLCPRDYHGSVVAYWFWSYFGVLLASVAVLLTTYKDQTLSQGRDCCSGTLMWLAAVVFPLQIHFLLQQPIKQGPSWSLTCNRLQFIVYSINSSQTRVERNTKTFHSATAIRKWRAFNLK